MKFTALAFSSLVGVALAGGCCGGKKAVVLNNSTTAAVPAVAAAAAAAPAAPVMQIIDGQPQVGHAAPVGGAVLPVSSAPAVAFNTTPQAPVVYNTTPQAPAAVQTPHATTPLAPAYVAATPASHSQVFAPAAYETPISEHRPDSFDRTEGYVVPEPGAHQPEGFVSFDQTAFKPGAEIAAILSTSAPAAQPPRTTDVYAGYSLLHSTAHQSYATHAAQPTNAGAVQGHYSSAYSSARPTGVQRQQSSSTAGYPAYYTTPSYPYSQDNTYSSYGGYTRGNASEALLYTGAASGMRAGMASAAGALAVMGAVLALA